MLVRQFPRLDEEPAIVTRVKCRCCGGWDKLYMFGSCRPCANRGKVRAMVVREYLIETGQVAKGEDQPCA